MSFYSIEKELKKSDIISDLVNGEYKGDLAYMIADNPFIVEAIENAILKEYAHLFSDYL